MRSHLKPVAHAVAVAFGGLLVASAAAQQPQVQEEVVVTGTRIRTPGVVSNSPISSLGSEEIKASQPVVVEEFFKTLPAAVPGIGSGTNNGTGGGATIDLRGLGSNRSLVLIDGRRVVPFNLTGVVDTNSIPIALLQRVDLITGGASAVYGADAIAGVANFVLRKDFKGFEASTSYGTSSKGDSDRRRTDFTWGAGLDNGRGNVALSFGFTNTSPLLQGERSFGKVALSSEDGSPAGSSNTVPLAVDRAVLVGTKLRRGQIDPATGAFVTNVQKFNFNPLNYFQTPLTQKQGTALGNFTINDHAEAYALFMFTRSDVRSQLAPSALFAEDLNVPLGNPFLPAPARQQLCTANGLTAAQCADNSRELLLTLRRRFVELGPRLNNFENKTHQITLGMRGDILAGWTYDLAWTQGQADQVETRINWGSLSKAQQALRALDKTTCLDPSNGCVPLNVFGPAGSITPEMLKFINLDAILLQNVTQKVVTGSVSGDLGPVKSPLSSAPIALALGYEYRSLNAGNKSDSATQVNGEVLGTGAPLPDHKGRFQLKEVFGEASLPLATDKPFVRKLSIEAGARVTEFETAGNKDHYNTWKLGGDWEPLQGIRARAMWQKATRAPNIDELFLPQITQLGNAAVDPCQENKINAAQANTPGTLSNLCRLTGVPLNQIGSLPAPAAGQVNILSGGNPALGPEVGRTRTIGFVLQPAFAKGLTVTADYYRIKITRAITNPSVGDVLDGCFNPTLNPGLTFNSFCALVGRNPNNGLFEGTASRGVGLALSNLGRIKTAGYDIGVNYGFGFKDFGINPKLGRVDASLNLSILDTYKFQLTPTSETRDCRGKFSEPCGTISAGGGPLSKIKWNQRTAWSVSDFVFSYNWRHLGAVREETGTDFLPAFSRIKAFNYFDLAAVYNFNKMLRVNFSVNNVADKKPPIVGNDIAGTAANSGNTFPQTYDVIGRFFTVGASLKF